MLAPSHPNRFRSARGSQLKRGGLTDARRTACHQDNFACNLAFHFAINDMAQLMQNSGKTGWLYRVIAGGQVSSDAPLELVSRLSDVSVHEAGAIAWQMPRNEPVTIATR